MVGTVGFAVAAGGAVAAYLVHGPIGGPTVGHEWREVEKEKDDEDHVCRPNPEF